jgi:hypothetical protein
LLKPRPQKRSWTNLGLAAVSLGLLVATLVQKDWIETAFGFRLDRAGGSAEWLVALLAAVCMILFAGLARPYAASDRIPQSLRCAECLAESEGNAVGWRAGFVSADEKQAEVIAFCPDCFEREFG